MKILPPVLFALFIVMAIVVHVLVPTPAIMTGWVRLISVPLFIGGLVLSVYSSRLFAQRGANIQTFEEPTALVTDGPFRWTRNPMYLGFVISLVGFAVGLSDLIALILVLLFIIICDRWYIRIEESAMSLRFGSAYEAYTQQVRRWI